MWKERISFCSQSDRCITSTRHSACLELETVIKQETNFQIGPEIYEKLAAACFLIQ